MKRHEWHCIA